MNLGFRDHYAGRERAICYAPQGSTERGPVILGICRQSDRLGMKLGIERSRQALF